jgi:hypothetical protein
LNPRFELEYSGPGRLKPAFVEGAGAIKIGHPEGDVIDLSSRMFFTLILYQSGPAVPVLSVHCAAPEDR